MGHFDILFLQKHFSYLNWKLFKLLTLLAIYYSSLISKFFVIFFCGFFRLLNPNLKSKFMISTSSRRWTNFQIYRPPFWIHQLNPLNHAFLLGFNGLELVLRNFCWDWYDGDTRKKYNISTRRYVFLFFISNTRLEMPNASCGSYTHNDEKGNIEIQRENCSVCICTSCKSMHRLWCVGTRPYTCKLPVSYSDSPINTWSIRNLFLHSQVKAVKKIERNARDIQTWRDTAEIFGWKTPGTCSRNRYFFTPPFSCTPSFFLSSKGMESFVFPSNRSGFIYRSIYNIIIEITY